MSDMRRLWGWPHSSICLLHVGDLGFVDEHRRVANIGALEERYHERGRTEALVPPRHQIGQRHRQ